MPIIGRVAGILDLSRISLGSVERIEIVKGASSSLYGSEALGGVVNIITNKAKTKALRKKFIISMALIILKIFLQIFLIEKNNLQFMETLIDTLVMGMT